MAKKKETLTPEEHLQAALVPEREQPYKVPKNWICFRFTSLIDIEGGTQPPKSQFINEYREGYIRLVQIRDFASDKYIVFVPDTAKLKHFNGDDILIARYGASLGRICTGMSGAYNVALAKTIFSSNILNRKYVYWMLQSESFQVPLMGISRTAQAGFNKEDLSTFAMPLPPLSEQQRIVNRIESLFAKLDEAKQKAQDALDSFETRKAAILHKAFTGELTAHWRKEHGVGMESWERLKLGEIGTLERGRSQHRPRNDTRLFGGPYPFIQTGDVASANVYIMEHHQTLSEFGMEQSRMFSAGTLCITIAANIGDVAILSYDCCFPDSVVGFIPNNRSISKFVYYMMSVLQKELEDNAPATAQKNINLKILNAVEMNIPPVIEQAEIVRLLDNLLAKEQQAKEVAEEVLEQIDLIKKAILARAFRGELGTNDPSEESAVSLLR